ncbi:hypothetical protein NYR88_10965 [Actinobacillus equuli subsp. haemolyticus]|nr:hypothetical protein NYR88_10965 [Actinobacillus equuli subsp. haemolyticus]
MKKTFFYSTVASAVALAISPAIAQETAVLDEVSVVSSGSMYKMGEVPVHQAKSAVAISREDLDKQDVKKADEIGRYQVGFCEPSIWQRYQYQLVPSTRSGSFASRGRLTDF